MNLVIDRDEVIRLTKLGRTKTFELQNNGDLKVQSTFAKKSWFDLPHVLRFLAAQHGYPAPDETEIAKHAEIILSSRLGNKSKKARKTVI